MVRDRIGMLRLNFLEEILKRKLTVEFLWKFI